MSAVTDTHVWLHHEPSDGYWQCPVDAVDVWTARGWQRCEAPPEVNLATAHWPAPAAPEPAAPAAKKSRTATTPPPGENEEKIDG